MIPLEHGNHAWFLIDRCTSLFRRNCVNGALHTAIEDTFNMVSVDGDTSTNDMGVRYGVRFGENQTITEKNHDYELFTQALTEVCAVLSRKITKGR